MLMNLPAKNEYGQSFPMVLNVTDTMAKTLSEPEWKGCEPSQPNAKYLQFPIRSAMTPFKGGETGPDRVLALTHGDYPEYRKLTYCGVFSHRGENDDKTFHACNKKNPVEDE